jgi:2-aminoadipate transaminase
VPGAISFARGAPHPDALATELIARCAERTLAEDGVRVLSYGNGQGYPPLREVIAAEHGVAADRVVITNGSLQGFALLLETTLDAGDLVAVEAPTYDRALLQLRLHGMRVLPVPVERDGLDVDALRAACDAGDVPRLLYTIPNFQNPSGATLSLEKRRALVELCERHDITVLEDDPYGKLRFEGESLPGLHELGGLERVPFTSSFSKTVAPGLRVGYMVSTAEVAGRIAAAASRTYISPALLAQGAVHQLITGGHLPGNVETVTRLMRERRDAMVAALDQMPEGTDCTPPEGGFFIWMTLPDGLSADALFDEAAAAGVAYVKGSDCYLPDTPGAERSLRLAYSGVSPDEITEGMARLGGVFRAAAVAG